MRVLKVVQSYFPFQDRGGPVAKVRALGHGLAQRGHHVTVLTADLGFKKRNGFGVDITRCPWGWKAESEGVEVFYLATFGHYRALTLNPHVVGFCGASLSRFDLVHFYGLYDLLGPAVSHFCRKQKIPYVIEPMGMYRPIDRSFRLKRLWHRALGGAFWQNASQIVATSEMEQQELLEDGIPVKKLVVRYNGIADISDQTPPVRGAFRTKWGIPPGGPLLVFLGRLIPRKGADLLIEAFGETCRQSGRLVIAGPEGEPGYRAVLEKEARDLGVQSRVVFTGPLYDEEKQSLLADADLFVLPSRYENFANTAAEAMACGVPVIVTEACGIRSLVSDRAGLVIPTEKSALTQAIRRLLSDQSLYARLKEGCRTVVEELNWNRLSEQMEGYYKLALAEGNGFH
jgi:glycosyltransferase involved in cell wall biosynthesis